MKVSVTVELEYHNLPDEAARELARQTVEARGLTVAKVAIVATSDRVKVFTPKAGAAGSTLLRGGQSYTVWGPSDHQNTVWATREGLYYRINTKSGSVSGPYHGDGKACAPSFYTDSSYKRHETPCQHASHAAERAA